MGTSIFLIFIIRKRSSILNGRENYLIENFINKFFTFFLNFITNFMKVLKRKIQKNSLTARFEKIYKITQKIVK